VVILQINSCGANFRERSIHPQNILASLRAKISEVMADMDREVVICPSKKFSLGLRLLWRPVGISLNKCVCNIRINFS
jgi:hypothetical protein